MALHTAIEEKALTLMTIPFLYKECIQHLSVLYKKPAADSTIPESHLSCSQSDVQSHKQIAYTNCPQFSTDNLCGCTDGICHWPLPAHTHWWDLSLATTSSHTLMGSVTGHYQLTHTDGICHWPLSAHTHWWDLSVATISSHTHTDGICHWPLSAHTHWWDLSLATTSSHTLMGSVTGHYQLTHTDGICHWPLSAHTQWWDLSLATTSSHTHWWDLSLATTSSHTMMGSVTGHYQLTHTDGICHWPLSAHTHSDGICHWPLPSHTHWWDLSLATTSSHT